MKKVRKTAFILSALALLAGLTACGDKSDGGSAPQVTITTSSDAIKASGKMAEKSIALSGGPYTVKAGSISMTEGKCELVITPAGTGSCIVTADDNLIDSIAVDVDETSGRIEISSGESFDGLNLHIEIAAAVEGIDVDGAYTVTYDAGTAEHVSITAAGACAVTASGECKTGECKLSGVVQLNAYDWKCEDLEISVEGTSNAEVYASGSLKATASGVSSVKYDGPPQDTDISADGLSSVEPR